jgi:hypothetical protein
MLPKEIEIQVKKQAETIRQLRRDIERLRAQQQMDIINRSITYSTITEPVVTGGTITGGTYDTPVVTNLTTADNKLITSTGNTLIAPAGIDDTIPTLTGAETMTNKTLTAPVVNTTITLVNGVNNSTITKNAGVDQVEYSGDVKVVNGIFGANSITVGDQTISEADGNLVLTDTTPMIRFIDSDSAGGSVLAGLKIIDKNSVEQGHMYINGAHMYVTNYSNNGDLYLETTRNVITNTDILPVITGTQDLGSAALEWKDLYIDGTAHIDTLDVDINATIAGTLTVTGTSTFNNTVTVTAVSDAGFYVYGNSADNTSIGLGRSGALEWTIGMKHDQDKVYILDGNIASTTGIYISGSSIGAASDEDHIINLDPSADTISVYPGDTAGDSYIYMSSSESTATYPLLVSHAHEYGQVGYSGNAWRYMYAKWMVDDDGSLSSYDETNDLALLENLDVWRKDGVVQKDEDGFPLLDYNTIPEFLKGRVFKSWRECKSCKNIWDNINLVKCPSCESHRSVFRQDETQTIKRKYIRASSMAAFSWGCIKQLHQKHKDLTDLVMELADEINTLKAE